MLSASSTEPTLASLGHDAETDPRVADAQIPARFAAARAVLASEPVRAAVVRRYFPRAGAALICVEREIALGDRLHVRGVTSDFLANVTSLRVAGVDVQRAAAGDATLALSERARAGDIVFALRAPA